jgi:hypothetical protein
LAFGQVRHVKLALALQAILHLLRHVRQLRALLRHHRFAEEVVPVRERQVEERLDDRGGVLRLVLQAHLGRAGRRRRHERQRLFGHQFRVAALQVADAFEDCVRQVLRKAEGADGGKRGELCHPVVGRVWIVSGSHTAGRASRAER